MQATLWRAFVNLLDSHLIEIFQDIVCPWCRIGKKNLTDALANFTSEPVEIHYRAYQLDPSTPIKGQASGLLFDFSKIEKMPNTLNAHQLIAIAPDEYKKDLVDDLFKAYFEEGKDIGHLDVLLDIAEQLGMNREQTSTLLSTKEGLEQVEDDLEFARQAGVTGVPFFVINRKYALTVAQSSDTFLQALQQISEEQPSEEA